MDPDFIREFSVLLGFGALYIGVSILLLRGHTTDLSAVSLHGGAAGGEGGNVPQRLNRRRKAIARDTAAKGAAKATDSDD